MNTTKNPTPKRGSHVAGPLSNTDYTIVSVGVRGTVGIAKGTGGLAADQWRIRVMPKDEETVAKMALWFLGGWKQPYAGNCRFSLVTRSEAVKAIALKIGKAAVTGGEITEGRCKTSDRLTVELLVAKKAAGE